MKSIEKVLDTYGAISVLAKVFRHNSVTFDAKRRENVAEHSYSLSVLAAAIADDLNQDGASLDIGKVIQFASVHDLTEAYMDEGDISVYASDKLLNIKKKSEEYALEKIKRKVGHPWVASTIETYESQNTTEARFVYALDKLVVHMNVILSDKHHAYPLFAKYLQTEDAARKKISDSYDGLLPYFDNLCSIFRDRPHFFKDAVS